LYDVVIVGAGPAGLSAAYAAKNAGLDYLVIERRCIVHTIYEFPIGLSLYSTPERIELADVPLIARDAKPTREDALRYYRRFVEVNGVEVRTYEEVTDVQGRDGDFSVATQNTGGARVYRTRKVVLATGAFDRPNRLGVPGEDLPKVRNDFREAHPYYGQDVLVVGGGSSAVETALSLCRAGAHVTLSYRRSAFAGLKYWGLPDLENRIREGAIHALMSSVVREIRPSEVVLDIDGHDAPMLIPNDFVFCMIGYAPDTAFFTRLGLAVDKNTCQPVHHPETFESTLPGIYVIGVITAGNISSEVFIENGRLHGPVVMTHIIRKVKGEGGLSFRT